MILSLHCSRCGAKRTMELEEARVLTEATGEVRCVAGVPHRYFTPRPVPCGGQFTLLSVRPEVVS